MRRVWHTAVTVLLPFCVACGDDPGLSDFYPPIPTSPGTGVTAGQVTDASQLVTGPAVSGLVGDFFMKNDRVTFIVQAPTRVIGVIPQGGNVVDAVLTDGTHQTVEDHFGELGLIYLLGRTCEPDHLDIVRDGSDGGAAVLRAVGRSGNDDFLDIKGIGAFPVDVTVDPTNTDGIQCATTYILEPGTTTLQVWHSLFNAGPDPINGPMGTLADTGGNTEAWTNARGFERSDITALATLSVPSPMDYVVYQGPGVAYGVIPRHDTPTTHAQALVAGVSILLDGNESLLDILKEDKYFLHLDKGKGLMQRYDLVVAKDGNGVDQVFRKDETLRTVSGKVTLSGGAVATGARVGFFADGNGNGQLDAADALDANKQPLDKIVTYADVAADGTYTAQVPTTAGNLLVRAEVKNVGRSAAAPVADHLDFTVPTPIKVDFQILDDETNQPIPGRLLVVGDHLAFPDKRVFETYDRLPGVVIQQHCIRGTTVDVGDGVDAPLLLPAGGTYRVYASRGTEWSMDSQPVTASGTLTFKLRHVIQTPNYYATDWHVHQIGSPDSNIPSDERIRSAVSGGVEMFAVTDHDYVSDLQPLVETMGLGRLLRVVPGIEVTPFAYGHFNSWPLTPDNDSANHGAIDWARGANEGLAMVPGEVFDAMRARGGKMVQVNHPRSTGFGEFQAAFTRANVKYDYANRTIFGDYENADVPNEDLRLPGESLWSDKFTGLEIWNGFDIKGRRRRRSAREQVARSRHARLAVDAVDGDVRDAGGRLRHAHDGRRSARHAAHVCPGGGRLAGRARERQRGRRGRADADRREPDGTRRGDHGRAVRRGDRERSAGARARGVRVGRRDADREGDVARLGRVRHGRGVRELDAGSDRQDRQHRAGAAQVLDRADAGREGSVCAGVAGGRVTAGLAGVAVGWVQALRGDPHGHARCERREHATGSHG